jgi:hypothetical protein
MMTDFSTFQVLAYITLVQLWWIAIWGIAYIVIEYLSNKSKFKELFIYFLLLTVIVCILVCNPRLINHF